jgi:hypothetical protein
MRAEKLASFVAVIGALAMSGLAFGGSGHVDRIADIQVESLSEGLQTINVVGTVLNAEEIEYLDMGRQFVVSKHGAAAKSWPLMVDFEAKAVQYMNRFKNEPNTIPFSDLKPNE